MIINDINRIDTVIIHRINPDEIVIFTKKHEKMHEFENGQVLYIEERIFLFFIIVMILSQIVH